MTVISVPKVPRAFIWRRLHSLMGLWFVLFLIEHLLTNSQAALWLGDNGKGFVDMVNLLHNLPYLQVIEVALLGIPILIHIVLGVKYLFTSKSNMRKGDGSQPYLPLKRNYAYTFQRITSWILLIGVIAHVYKFRFLEYPQSVKLTESTFYLVKVDVDQGLYTLADRLNVTLYDKEAIAKQRQNLETPEREALIQEVRSIEAQQFNKRIGPIPEEYSLKKAAILSAAQRDEDQEHFITVLEKERFTSTEVIAATQDFGTATLLSVRDTFKQPIYIGLYTIFVLAACFHAFNGFWTFLISWGWVLKMAAQRTWVGVSVVLMLIMSFLGLAAIWGSYWFNLKV